MLIQTLLDYYDSFRVLVNFPTPFLKGNLPFPPHSHRTAQLYDYSRQEMDTVQWEKPS